MKFRHTRSIAGLGAFALTALMSLPAHTQTAHTQSSDSAAARPASSTQASTAVYTPEPARQVSIAAPAQSKRKPRWFDERRQQAETSARTARFERLSYTRYEGETDLGSGSCVYYQSSYTYSCR